MYKLIRLLVLLFLVGCFNVLHPPISLSDEPEFVRDSAITSKATISYDQALKVWKTAEDLNEWIAANFTYDTDRAMKLAENNRARNERISIYNPSEFFKRKSGVCVDLARFGVETLRSIDPNSDAKYLMIEFDPIQIKGNTLRLHWLVSFKRHGRTYFFLDSKRPEYIAGPYNNIQAFIREYEQYRGRKIVSYRELESYQRQRRSQSLKKQAQKALSRQIRPTDKNAPADLQR